MPRGIYPRTPNQLKAAVANLARGREAPARAKAAKANREIAKSEAWRDKVSQATKAAMQRPDVRERHRAALTDAANFKGGNGRPVEERARSYLAALQHLGWTAEHPIPTKGHGTPHRPPPHYKADLADIKQKIVLELDGQAHRPHDRRALDRKKDAVLMALGWTVVRVAY